MAQKGIIKNSVTADVSASNMAAIFQGIFGKSGIVSAFNNLACTKLTDNSVQLDSGVYSLKGFLLQVETGTTATLTIDSGTAGQKRNDLVVAELVKNGGGGGIDTLQFRVIKGTSTTGTPVDPTLTQQDVNAAGVTRQEALYRIKLDGVTITTIETLAESVDNLTTLVTESGGNSTTGYYKKFSDGTMICYGRRALNPLSISGAWGAFYLSGSIATTYPEPFVGAPASISVNMENTTGEIAFWLNVLSSASSFDGYFGSAVSGSFNCTMAWMAVGRCVE